MNRTNTLFSVRYAARVLERHTRIWRMTDGFIRVAALLSGSAAFAALTAGNQVAVIVLGVVFAIFQALEFAIRPAEQAARSMAMRKPYARLLAAAGEMDDEKLESSYLALVAEDDVVVPHWLREVAYNDVLFERGCDPSYAYALSSWQRFVAFIA